MYDLSAPETVARWGARHRASEGRTGSVRRCRPDIVAVRALVRRGRGRGRRAMVVAVIVEEIDRGPLAAWHNVPDCQGP